MVVQQPNVTRHNRLVKLAEGKYRCTDCFIVEKNPLCEEVRGRGSVQCQMFEYLVN